MVSVRPGVSRLTEPLIWFLGQLSGSSTGTSNNPELGERRGLRGVCGVFAKYDVHTLDY